MKKILITGTAGFIGFHLIKKLKETQYGIIGLDNINNYYDVELKYARLKETGILKDEIIYGKVVQSNIIPSYKFIQLDLCDKEKITELFIQEQFDAVIHLAAQAGVRYSITNPHAYTNSNVTGFLNILEGCRAVNTKHLVYASTSSVYGLNTNMPLNAHESTEHPITLYAATKKANEMMAHSYSHLFNLPVTGVRFFTVYGPWGRPDMALFLFTKAILNNEPVKVFNNGEMIRDFTYAEDIAEGLQKILEKPAQPCGKFNSDDPDPSLSSAPYRIINIGNAKPVKLMDYIEAIENTLGKKAAKTMLPMQPGDVPATSADITDLINEYNYKPATNVKEGVKKFIDWYRAFYKA
jgi:UDP-glucuronate 4-epimerase